jgi:hypothetical protein
MAENQNAIDLPLEIVEGIKELQQRKKLLNNELASIGELRLVYKNREAQAQQYYTSNIDLEKTLAKEIEQKLGRGRVDIDKGKFYPLT